MTDECRLNVLLSQATFSAPQARMCQIRCPLRRCPRRSPLDLDGISPRPSHAPRRACLLSDISQTDSQYPLNTPSPTRPPTPRPDAAAPLSRAPHRDLASISPRPRLDLAAISQRSRRDLAAQGASCERDVTEVAAAAALVRQAEGAAW